MSESSPPNDRAPKLDPRPQQYKPPRIAWEEPYEPLGFGVSCTKVSGNPGCVPGPSFT